MSNTWFRMYGEFANDPKVQMLDESLQRRLVMLFCFRCNVSLPLQDEEVAFQLRISRQQWDETKSIFLDKGFIDSSNNIINWEKRQYKSDSSLERVRRHREAKKQSVVTISNVTVTSQSRADTEQIQNRTEQSSSAHEIPAFQKIYDEGCIVFPSLQTANTSSIQQWISAGCDPDLDAIPEIKRHAKAGKAVKAWSYFTGGIMDAKATRETLPPKGTPHGTGKKSTIDLLREGTERARAARQQESTGQAG